MKTKGKMMRNTDVVEDLVSSRISSCTQEANLSIDHHGRTCPLDPTVRVAIKFLASLRYIYTYLAYSTDN